MLDLVYVFVWALLTALATGLGVVPFMFTSEFSDRWICRCNAMAAGAVHQMMTCLSAFFWLCRYFLLSVPAACPRPESLVQFLDCGWSMACGCCRVVVWG